MEQIKYCGDGIIVYTVAFESVNYHENSLINRQIKYHTLGQLFHLEQLNSVLKVECWYRWVSEIVSEMSSMIAYQAEMTAGTHVSLSLRSQLLRTV